MDLASIPLDLHIPTPHTKLQHTAEEAFVVAPNLRKDISEILTQTVHIQNERSEAAGGCLGRPYARRDFG